MSPFNYNWPARALMVVLSCTVLTLTNTNSSFATGANNKTIIISLDGFGWKWFIENPAVKIPTIRKLMTDGSSGPMEVSFPSVTWASHTSLITGAFPREHGVTGNSILNRKTGQVEDLIGDAVYNKDDIVKVDTIYDMAKKQKGLKTAAISWPLTRGSKTLDYIVAEAYSQAVYVKTARPDNFFEQLKKSAIPVDRYGPWSELAVSEREDWLTTQISKYLIRNDNPDLMVLHFLVTDSYSHLYGAGSPESIWAAEYLDDRVKDIIDTLKAQGIYDDTNIFIVSDHGFHNITRAIKPNVALKIGGYIQLDKYGHIDSERVHTVMNHGAAHVYVLDNEHRDEIIADIKPKLRNLEGIKAVYDDKEFDRLGLPSPKVDGRMADLILEAKPNYYIVNDVDGIETLGQVTYVGTHGHDPSSEEMKAAFIAVGPDIKRGLGVEDITVRDLAPTVARIMGLKMPEYWPGAGGRFRPGRVLTEILK